MHSGYTELAYSFGYDGFCGDNTYTNWQDIQDTEMTLSAAGSLVATVITPNQANPRTKCLLAPTSEDPRFFDLTFVFKIVYPDGNVSWETPNGGFGSYYQADLGFGLRPNYNCDDASDSDWAFEGWWY